MSLALPATVTLQQVPDLLARLDQAVASASGGELVVDASGLQELDSSTLALLLRAQRALKASGGRLVVRGAPPRLRELARLYGVETVLPLEAAPAV